MSCRSIYHVYISSSLGLVSICWPSSGLAVGVVFRASHCLTTQVIMSSSHPTFNPPITKAQEPNQISFCILITAILGLMNTGCRIGMGAGCRGWIGNTVQRLANYPAAAFSYSRRQEWSEGGVKGWRDDLRNPPKGGKLRLLKRDDYSCRTISLKGGQNED